mmetsp:Transcript_154702/g.494688  ORF Transcript_154702/g.494688 Transcript_154702/m.494688 type:complete len:337 (+) Transcript_154702:2180-3190(+)
MCHSSSCTRDAPSVLPHKPSHASSAPPRCSAHAPPGTHRCDSQVVSSTRSCAPRPHGWGPRPQSLIRSSRISPTSLRSMRSTIFMMPSLTSWMPTSASSPPSTSDSLRSSCSTFLEAAPSTTSTSWWKDRLITTLVATDDHHVARNPRETGSRPRSRRTLTCEGCRHRSLDVHGHGLPSIMRKGLLGQPPGPTTHLDLRVFSSLIKSLCRGGADPRLWSAEVVLTHASTGLLDPAVSVPKCISMLPECSDVEHLLPRLYASWLLTPRFLLSAARASFALSFTLFCHMPSIFSVSVLFSNSALLTFTAAFVSITSPSFTKDSSISFSAMLSVISDSF